MKLNSTLRIILINLAVLIGLLVVIELVFGSWFSSHNFGLLNIPRDMEKQTDVTALYADCDPCIITYKRDHWGLRGDYGGEPANIQILTMGGSTTDQLHLDESQTWQAVMEDRLAELSQSRIVANAGRDGQSTIGHLVALRDWLPKVPGLQPEIILYYVGINDQRVSDRGIVSVDAMKSRDAGEHWVDYVKNSSILYRISHMVKGYIKAKEGRLTHDPVDYQASGWSTWTAISSLPWADVKVEYAEALEAYAQRLRQLAAATDVFGAKPVFITQPWGTYQLKGGRVRFYNGADVDAKQGYMKNELFNQTTLSVCEELELTCFDLASEVSFKQGDFYDVYHTTPGGAEKIGKYLARQLQGFLQ